ncbi:hypothetical protein B0F90DRAFT_1810052 [Multifurca ochricompacta]|uniref:J domain-containing protein n=1 Tax=Multifurca ochricompacta TaxID=376703 RepID=A0AAD4QP13_9AGAM|nr:hypothetical protein B0F90DRAFT_1810052 [Multifurca ochricompacta]
MEPNYDYDYYALLGITRSASPNTIKAAYHRTLLRLHPDKQRQQRRRSVHDPAPAPLENANVIGLLHDAFITLSSNTLRTAYDAHSKLSHTVPRPAQIVSLDDFDCLEGIDSSSGISIWSLTCRCDNLENGHHLIGCGGCSEVIWVGYEMVMMDE